MSRPIAVLQDVAKAYPGAGEVLVDVSLEVFHGDLIAVRGDSGAGKTTLLNLLGCVDRPTRGRYDLGGRSVQELSDRELGALRAERIGFVFQNYHLIEYLTVRQNLESRFLYRGASWPSDGSNPIHELLDRLGIAHLAERHPRRLSGGEMQRVALARALVARPRLLLADEPTGNLDRKNSERVLQRLEAARELGTAVILATHDRGLAQRCERRYRIDEGRLVDDP